MVGPICIKLVENLFSNYYNKTTVVSRPLSESDNTHTTHLTTMSVRTFGIRHHGPGSAAALRQALQNWAPDCLLIECPEETEVLLLYVANKKLVPPVAMLVYNSTDLNEASYLPLAEFSPEWVALRYAMKQDIPTRCIDLPVSISRQIKDKRLRDAELGTDENTKALLRDPLGYMARLAGYEDSERWWEATFEHPENEEEIFAAILEMMQALRTETAHREAYSNLVREANMRQNIRKASEGWV